MDVVFEISVSSRHIAVVSHGKDHAQVCVVGNTAELGTWETTKAVPLTLMEETMTENKFGVTVQFPSERMYKGIEYKYILKDTVTNEVVSWESLPGNRTFTLTPTTNVALGKPAKQSSTYSTDRVPCPGTRPASLGNNGCHNGFYEWTCPRTTRELNPWWSVDLESPVPLNHLNLWKAMTYHEQPKRSTARPPISSVVAGSNGSALRPPRVWVIVSTDDLSGHVGEDLIKQIVDGRELEGTKVFPLELHEDVRVESLELGGITARYVRLQYESQRNALQFAELELFTDQGSQSLQRIDGFYGVGSAIDADLAEYVDSEWVDPLSDHSMVRLWIGSFQKDVPAIQWYDGSNNTRPIRVSLRHHLHAQDISAKLQVQDVPVDSRGALLLDKEGNEFRETLTGYLENKHLDLKPFVNSIGVTSIDEWVNHYKRFGEDNLGQVRSEVSTRTFQDGEALLQYGERTRMAFFIIEGEVEIKGPPAVTGTITLGSLAASSSINDLALFSSWPTRSASFIAKGRVVAQILTYETLKNAVGDAVLRSVRHSLLRERVGHDSHPPQGKLFVVDEDHAQTFRTKVPTKALVTANATSTHRFTLDFYEGTAQAKGVLVGSCVLLPNQLNQHGEGYMTLPILAKPNGTEDITIIGQVALHYLVVRPFVHTKNNLSNTWRSYWRERVPQGGGHRGMGRHFNQVGGFRKALTRENTLASFILAGRNGADFVEFDVQLTKDDVPVLYHDFIFRVGLEDKRAWSQSTLSEPHEIAIHQLMLRELTRSQTTVVRKDPPRLQRLIKKHWSSIVRSSDSSPRRRLDPARGNVGVDETDDEHLVDFYPRLEDLLKHVPPEIGLNIEIKYPDNFKRSSYRFSPSFAINYYIDTILACVFEHAEPGRRIFFSCFDPDLVVALRAKQATYPVFFLTYGRVKPTFDARLTLQFASNFVRMEKLRGIVSNSDEFLVEPTCAELIKRDGIVLMTWGDQNTSHECVQLQKRHGIDGVISDNIGDLTRADHKAIVPP